MSNESANEAPKAEILIIRRGHGDDNVAHKGGAWKIAYADFVTAMMAFFLVMWLINSANEVTRARVASYFNPIKMTDSAASGRGLNEATAKAHTTANNSETSPKSEKISEGSTAGLEASAALTATQREEALMGNPFQVLDALSVNGNSELTGKLMEIPGAKAGDPFDPKAWQALRDATKDASKGGTQEAQTPEVAAQGGHDKAFQNPPGATAAQNAVAEQIKAKIQQAAEQIGVGQKINIVVTATADGYLISLSDRIGSAMFEIGSATPTTPLVALVSDIGRLLQGSGGKVIVRGHTDARQYKTLKFDNWQLSTARAHMASYMLIRGGLEESRLVKVEGYGSTEPLKNTDPLAAENRRVEFLLQR